MTHPRMTNEDSSIHHSSLSLQQPSFSSELDAAPYGAILIVSFGGPEGPEDVLPFLENVLRGKNVPRDRLLAVAEHYHHFGGVSPINEQNRLLVAALEAELARDGIPLPVYWGNRNWKPFLVDALNQMARDGVKRALAFFTSAYSSYSGCRQYRENIAAAQAEVGPSAPRIDKLRAYFNHPGFIETMVESLRDRLNGIPSDRRGQAKVLFSAHSIPVAMAENCRYVQQLQEASRLVAQGAGLATWELVYQSRSGPPTQAWLEPDIGERIKQLHAAGGLKDVVVVPIGFISDHMEVLYDLDTEVRQLCEQLGVRLHRTPTVGCHPRFIAMIRELITERLERRDERRALGVLGPSPDVCAADCCLFQAQRPAITN